MSEPKPLALADVASVLLALGRQGAAPPVLLHLASGRELAGKVLAFDGKTFVLGTVDDRGNETGDMCYVPGPSVAGLTVRGGNYDARTQAALARGAADPLDGKEAPGRLAVQRRLAALGAKLGLPVEAEPGALDAPAKLLGVDELAAALERAFHEVMAHADGRAAVAAKIKRIAVAQAASALVHLDAASGTLTLSSPFDGPAPARLGDAALARELNRLL